MKLNIQKLQQGNQINFWGIKNGQYTDNYKNAVNNIVNNPETFNRISQQLRDSGIQINDTASFNKLAFDNKVGPVHNSIINYGKSLKTTPLPKDLVRYRYSANGGFKNSTSEQLINTHKSEFNKLLDINKNDSTKAYSDFTQNYPSVRKIGKYSGKNPMPGTTTPIYKQLKGGILKSISK